mgnify:CR=1 FL=1
MDLSSVVFIGLMVTGATQFIKLLAPKVNGAVTIAVATALGGVVALVDTQIGLDNISIALGLATGLSASGAVTLGRNLVSGSK